MENTTNNISVDRVLELQANVNAKQVALDSANQVIGSKDAHIKSLEKQIKELESKQPEVRITKGGKEVIGYGSFGNITNDVTSTIEYRNLDSVKSDIQKDLDKKYKSDIEKLEKELKDTKKTLTTTLEDKDNNVEKVIKQYNQAKENIQLEYDIRRQELERDYKDKSSKKDLKIKELQEEIIKIKENKTDEEVEAKRTEEVNKLKLQIKDLKKQIDDFLKMNPFKRVWYTITNRAIRIAAEKEVMEREREIEKLNTSKGRGLLDFLTPGINSNKYYWGF